MLLDTWVDYLDARAGHAPAGFLGRGLVLLVLWMPAEPAVVAGCYCVRGLVM